MKNFSYLNKYLSNFNDIKIPLDFDFSSLGGSNLLNPTSGFSADSSSLLDLGASGGLNTTQSGNQNESLSYLENLENVLIYSVHYEGDEEGITEIGDKTYKFDLFGPLFQIALYIRQNKIDIVHTFMNMGSLFGVLAAKITGRPAVASMIRDAKDSSVREKYLKLFISKIADIYVANSHAGFKNRFSKIEPHFRVVYNGIDLSRFEQILLSLF